MNDTPTEYEDDQDDGGWTREAVQALIDDQWQSTYDKAYKILLFEADRCLTKEETYFLGDNGFLNVVSLPNPPDPDVFFDLRILAFQAFDDGRLWSYDSRVRALSRWRRRPYCILDPETMGKPNYAVFRFGRATSWRVKPRA